PGIDEKVSASGDELESNFSAEDILLAELNDVVAIAPAERGAENGAIRLETSSYRLIATPDSVTRDHLVIVHVVRKSFRLDALFQSERWISQAQFTSSLPRTASAKKAATGAIELLYIGLEAYLDEMRLAERHDADRA